MRILLVDDHALFRDGLALLLQKLAADVDVIEADNAKTALEALVAHPDIDFMLLDLNMPGVDGFSILQTTTTQHPTVPVAILSASSRQVDIDRVMATSAVGYINKNTQSEVILEAIRLMLAGGIYTPPRSMGLRGSPNGKAVLTARQTEVLVFLVDGYSNKQIAESLGIAEATIKMHVTAILQTLNVDNRTQAALAGRAML